MNKTEYFYNIFNNGIAPHPIKQWFKKTQMLDHGPIWGQWKKISARQASQVGLSPGSGSGSGSGRESSSRTDPVFFFEDQSGPNLLGHSKDLLTVVLYNVPPIYYNQNYWLWCGRYFSINTEHLRFSGQDYQLTHLSKFFSPVGKYGVCSAQRLPDD